MPRNTDSPAQALRRREAWRSVIFATVFRLLMAAVVLGLRWHYQMEGFAGALLLIVAVVELGTIVPAWMSLKVRLKEIEGGEEDAASQY